MKFIILLMSATCSFKYQNTASNHKAESELNFSTRNASHLLITELIFVPKLSFLITKSSILHLFQPANGNWNWNCRF